METKPKYLVRPHDYHIFDLDESNGCYRSWSTRNVTYSGGTRPNAMSHFTLENLTINYDFFPIDEEDLKLYVDKNNLYHKWISWSHRNDGHSGIKGGTMEEYLERFGKKNVLSIELTRSDLTYDKKLLSLKEISLFDFKLTSLNREDIRRAHYVTFIDDDGTKKVLKSIDPY